MASHRFLPLSRPLPAIGPRHPQPSQYTKLVWSDKFTGPASTASSSSKVDRRRWAYGWTSNVVKTYTDSAANASLDGQGHRGIVASMKIIARTALGSAFRTSGTSWSPNCDHTAARQRSTTVRRRTLLSKSWIFDKPFHLYSGSLWTATGPGHRPQNRQCAPSLSSS